MTLIWLVVWFIANNVGGGEPLTFDPVNAWVGTLAFTLPSYELAVLTAWRLKSMGIAARRSRL